MEELGDNWQICIHVKIYRYGYCHGDDNDEAITIIQVYE